MQIQTFQETKKIIIDRINAFGALTIVEIYEYSYDKLNDHQLVKCFLLKQGYNARQISRAKYNFKKRLGVLNA